MIMRLDDDDDDEMTSAPLWLTPAAVLLLLLFLLNIAPGCNHHTDGVRRTHIYYYDKDTYLRP